MKLFVAAIFTYLAGVGWLCLDNRSVLALVTAVIGGAVMAGKALRSSGEK